MNSTVGVIEYDARISTAKLKKDSAEVDAIAKNTGDNIGEGMEKGEGRATAALSKMAQYAKYALVGTAAAVSAAIGKFVIGGGISRALNIEDAQAKLKGLGHDVKSVQTIMDSALQSVKGTAFGLDAAATAAASAVAAGVKPGKDLTRVLALTGDTATITGRSFNEAGAIINKVLASNRLSMEEVNQLSDAGLPILSMLGKQYGKTAAQMREMVSDGEVDSEKFLKALETNIGGAALKSGETTRGAWNNMQAAMSRVGAAIVKDIIPRVRESFGSLTVWFDTNSTKIVSAVGRTMEVMKLLAGRAVEIGQAVAEYLLPKLTALWNTLSLQVFPILTRLYREILVPLAPLIGTVLVGALGLAIDALNIFFAIISPIFNWMLNNKVIVTGLAAAFGILALAMNFNAIVAGFNGAINSAIVTMNILRLVTIPSALTSLSQFAAGFGPVGIAAALAAAVIVDAGNKAKAAWENTSQAIRSASDSNDEVLRKLQTLSKSGTPEQQQRAKATLKKLAEGGAFASGTNSAPGGLSLVGEKGPELINLPRGSQVIPNHDLGSVGGSVTVNLNMSGIMARSKADERDIAKSFIKRINEELAAKGKPLLGGGSI